MIKIACFKGLTPKSENLIKRLDVSLFSVQLKSILLKPGLKKARKASQFSKR